MLKRIDFIVFIMDTIGKFEVKRFSKNRRMLAETYNFFLKKHYMTGFIEIDVTKGRELIAKFEKENNVKISFTAWLTKSLSKIVEANPHFNSYRKGRNKIIMFEDIDIIVMIEREINNKMVPIAYSVRKTQEKSLLDISNEIREAQSKKVTEKEQLLDQDNKAKYFNLLPKFLRRFLMNRYLSDPFTIKKNGGLIIITSVGMFGDVPGWISGFGGLTTLNLSVASIKKYLTKINNEIVERESLHLTISFDHDLIDGAPAVRFTQEFVNLLRDAILLEEL
ncbi:MAG: 2-oxo acid dehydrogenase subunit E2 [Asgard group archaeon]|nr:2-oxo acid dehydrogenase subunit E2 [Asgard group archaeon]